MASVTFPAGLGGDGSTVTDDDNASTGLGNGGHRLRFVPALAQTVVMAQTAKDRAAAAASSAGAASTSETNAGNSATAAAGSASAASTSETNAGNSASAASTSEDNAADSETAAAASAATAGTRESGAIAAAASAEADADRAEAAAQGLLGRRTVVNTVAENIDVADVDSGTHYRCARSTRQEIRLSETAALGATVHVQARGAGLVAFVGGLIRSRGGRRHVTEQDGQVTATKTAQTEWSIAGDLGDVQTQQSEYQLAVGGTYQLAGGSTYQVTSVTAA
ncbi:hypothetical protein [Algiphilus sp.]|uniref:hypothetical protein n=1 Tax=Algiphilus sp. TaxID=1872431 RepID=UPI0025C3B7FD|nr:hypothetical protein [Algiphilus sp.]MCK5769463.1 hypothetical protein [Algiphilus sp.]